MNSSKKDGTVVLNANVLVLDDEPLVRLMICTKLEQVGALVSEAACCADALRLARNTDFDVALFDYRLPDGDGLDLVRQLRREGFSLPIAMLSGEAADIEAEAGNDLGICAVFTKPPDVTKIAETLAREAACQAVQKTEYVGRYAYWQADPNGMEAFAEWSNNEWLAIDLSLWGDVPLPVCLMECIEMPHLGVAVVGASQAMHEGFKRMGSEIEFVANVDELAALSRRPFSPLERAALLEVPQLRC
ncbi:response regulator [Pontiellaceae bacterium B1224]|nr:response regulator [Pontiellaceae bacterium B1224]